MDIEDLRTQANAWAKNNVGCSVELVSIHDQEDGSPSVATFRMVDEDGEETARVDVKDAGTYLGRQMMFLMDEEGDMVCEAFGENIARLLYV